MRRIKRFLAPALISLLLFSACSPETAQTPQDSTGTAGQTATADVITEEPTETPAAEQKTDAEILADFYGGGYNTNTLIGIDQFGRVFEAGGNDREDKEVGIFYWPWFKEGSTPGVYNNTEILAMENGLSILTSPDLPNPEISPAGEDHYWGEPLFGYYNSKDKWVIRRHLRMLELAGVDYICFDCTNAVAFVSEARTVLDCITELQEAGFDPPRLTFYTHHRSIETMRRLYANIYKKGYGRSGWYTYNGKPMIIGYTKAQDDKKASFGNYNPSELSQEILDFFTFVRPEWPNEYKTYPDSIAWVEWKYPAPVHNYFDCITVSPAAHPGCPFSFSLTGRSTNWGRGWNPDTGVNVSQDVEKGTYYQKTWDTALLYNPDMIFIGGWNEWTMNKFMYGEEYVLVDNVNMEYSRDIEPMKGGYNDAFYMQTVANIRKYKKTELPQARFASVTPGDDFDWDGVTAVFRKFEAVNEARDAGGKPETVYYTQEAARNNITQIQVVTDEFNIYFRILCSETITPRQDASWMNLFIGTGELEKKGWEGYEFVVNRSGEGNVDKLSEDMSCEPKGNAVVTVHGNAMFVTVPRALLGLGADDNGFYFKVADNITHAENIMDYYVSGCSVPMGRMSFRYVG